MKFNFSFLHCQGEANSVKTLTETRIFSQAPNLIFLAVSPEEKESWINALNSAITRAKNRVLDEVRGVIVGRWTLSHRELGGPLQREEGGAGRLLPPTSSAALSPLESPALLLASKSFLPAPVSPLSDA